MTWRIRNIVLECPDPAALSAFYAELLGMDVLRKPPDWTVIGREGELPRLAFDHAEDYRAPRWPDPGHPQQLHLDIEVPDLAATEAWLASTHATRLPDIGGDGHVWADPAGHPFCLCMERSPQPRIANVVFDSADHTALAAYYSQLLGLPKVGAEWPDWVMLGGPSGLRLAFAKVAVHRRPAWPDPEHPQQLHLDLQFDDQAAAMERAVELGGLRLPEQGGDAPVFADPAGHPFCALPVYGPKIRQLYADAWAPWVEAVRTLDATAAGSSHDLVAEVQATERHRLAHLAGAFGGRLPEWTGGGPSRLVEEAEWIRDRTIEWLGNLDENLLDVEVGWVDGPDGPTVRRTREAPAATDPSPVWEFVQPNQRIAEPLDRIRGR